MKQKKISVVIPVYNGETYISRCVDSVLSQANFRLNDIDIVLINDGSTDGSLSILRQYEAKYPKQVRVVNQKNMGVANTRNVGIDLALGKYIIFIDQDDYINPDYCSTFYGEIELSGNDVVGGGYTRPDINGNIRQVSLPKEGLEYSKYIIVAAWAKIHRVSFLKQHNVRFFENKFGEDSVFTVKEISKTKKWKQIDYIGYNWFLNESSVSNTVQKQLGISEVDALIVLLDKLKSSFGDTENDLFQYYLLRTCVYYLLFSGRAASPKDFVSACNRMFSSIHKSVNWGYLISFRPRGEVLSVKISILIIVTLYKIKLIGLFAKFYCKG